MQSETSRHSADNPNPLNRADLNRLRQAVSPGPVLILAHHNPDPDALAAGAGLAYLLESMWGLAVRKVFSGLVARAENIAMLKHLTPDWTRITAFSDVAEYGRIALVDTQPGAGNNILPSHIIPDAVFDHHQPMRHQVDATPYLDLRPDVGAAATLVYQYLEIANLTLPSRLATALFYGIKTDTRGLSRGASTGDKVAYVNLLSNVDHDALLQVEYARRPATFFRSLMKGLAVTRVYGSAVVAILGNMDRSDFAAELADQLIMLEGARGVLCVGRYKGVLHLSVRTMPLGEDAGLLIQRVVSDLGRGGGHGVMAGGQVTLTNRAADVIESELAARFLVLMEEDNTPGESLIGH
jgi:nanoRNase/pAp phosphatase (c-di-AMP/oligoRNAs hydrolase)